MKYSILIPAFNCADTIEKTVSSLQNAGLTDFEILIVNDGSRDRTMEVLEALHRQYPNVVVLTKENGGVSSARNLGLRHATGEYLVFVDADDVLEENAYCRAADIIAAEKPDMLLFGMTFEHYHRGVCYQSEQIRCPREGMLTASELESELDTLFRRNYLSPIWNKMIRREIVAQNGICFTKEMFLMEDCKFSLDCLRCCRTIYLLSDTLYRYQLLDDGKKARERVRRIESLNDYMENFRTLSECFPSVVCQIYDMLFRQRLYEARSVSGLKRELRDCRESSFYEHVVKKRVIPELLRTGHYRKYLLRNCRHRLRHRFVVLWKTAVRRFRG